MIITPWPNLEIIAQNRGIVDPYRSENAALFRGEEAFDAAVTGRARWSKPSPEPALDADFESVLLDSIDQNAAIISGLARELARVIAEFYGADDKPILVAILRAGVPITALLSLLLEEKWGETVPTRAFSLFYGLGWDEKALENIVAEFPGRPLLFVDGWTSGGNVAIELKRAFEGWKRAGKADFTRGQNPKLAVLCDPRGKADFRAVRADLFVPSACFTAPETLGFSRGFALGENEMFGVYEFPSALLKPLWLQKWLEVLDAAPAPLPPDEGAQTEAPPPNVRVDVNEVVRALINRDPREIWLCDEELAARKHLAPLLHLAKLRSVPVRFGSEKPRRWGAIAAAQMA
ncbi:Phosphoribosyl transferase (PRTase) [Abditibacterium utsteinense]|uniref:Phosphoribosyl transferase (PRTase) n=1 Tax=Abditibacterium utsteinense TaxID=1960156 RepID=A0A2S8SQ80_9BACT|nr:cysteine protease StiP domain-containing protein [Abditibacterium utsteinense]PQV62948.1 Phosphoribosyl transferase (PRTase) [Abditibacterium utsteinense]